MTHRFFSSRLPPASSSCLPSREPFFCVCVPCASLLFKLGLCDVFIIILHSASFSLLRLLFFFFLLPFQTYQPVFSVIIYLSRTSSSGFPLSSIGTASTLFLFTSIQPSSHSRPPPTFLSQHLRLRLRYNVNRAPSQPTYKEVWIIEIDPVLFDGGPSPSSDSGRHLMVFWSKKGELRRWWQ